ncbi:MAG: hypothetical protein KC609_26540 [Myxococcales bacterium]|nr:hypothetical protein [Myxococcales bacterium]
MNDPKPSQLGALPPSERNARLWTVSAAILMLAISIAHYTVPTHHTPYHDLLRRLYYLPVLMIALVNGLRGGLIAALGTALIYAPHAFLIEHHLDPSPAVNKLLEIAFYFVIGGLVGAHIDRERRLTGQLSRAETEKKAIQRSLERTARLAALGELSAGLAHEIRNPLASIKGAAEILADDFGSEHPKRNLAEILVREADRLNAVLQRFLSFARPDRAELRATDVGALVAEVVGLVQKQAEQHNVTLSARIDAEIRPIEADADQLRQLALNLVLNGVQAVDDGGHVWVRLYESDERLALEVSDDGPGIPEADRDRVFDPFVTGKDEGTGLGLAISLLIVEAHGGYVEIGEREPTGARVQVYLPRRSHDDREHDTTNSADR